MLSFQTCFTEMWILAVPVHVKNKFLEMKYKNEEYPVVRKGKLQLVFRLPDSFKYN